MSVEIEAISAAYLRDLCRNRIERHIDPEVLRRLRTVEASERRTLRTLLDGLDRR